MTPDYSADILSRVEAAVLPFFEQGRVISLDDATHLCGLYMLMCMCEERIVDLHEFSVGIGGVLNAVPVNPRPLDSKLFQQFAKCFSSNVLVNDTPCSFWPGCQKWHLINLVVLSWFMYFRFFH